MCKQGNFAKAAKTPSTPLQSNSQNKTKNAIRKALQRIQQSRL
jgi:hypothetical protein